MSTLDIKKTVVPYIITSIVCGIISFVYEQFSHDVYSNYMIFTFVYPLAGCLLYFVLNKLVNKVVFNSAWITLLVGSFMMGVLEIYGTTNKLIVIYQIAGIALFVLSFVLRERKASK